MRRAIVGFDLLLRIAFQLPICFTLPSLYMPLFSQEANARVASFCDKQERSMISNHHLVMELFGCVLVRINTIKMYTFVFLIMAK